MHETPVTPVTPTNGRRRAALLAALLGAIVAAAMLAGPSIASAGPSNAAYLTSPLGQTLSSPNQTFTWNAATGATEYYLYVGRSLGSSNIYNSGAIWAPTTSKTATNLPADGTTLYVRLWTCIGGKWLYNDYTFAAAQPASRITPANGSTLYAVDQFGCPIGYTFSWTAAGGDTWWLYVGTTYGGYDVANSGSLGTTSYGPVGLPNPGTGNSEIIYVRLWTHVNGSWTYSDFVYNDVGGPSPCSP